MVSSRHASRTPPLEALGLSAGGFKVTKYWICAFGVLLFVRLALNKSEIQDFKGVNEAPMRQVFQQRMRDLGQALNCPPRVCDVEVKDGAMVQGSARE